ncbi:MAG: OPT family oligopeptide transporter [Pseudomonadota bacterium]|nr:OPT family oligopeptide transporter [Pseudomonadota bacterium]
MHSATRPHPPLEAGAPQLTLRALATGMAIGGLLAPCNIYTGLKIGWSFNMSIAAALVGLAFWRLLEPLGARRFGLMENTINQTTASAAAAIVSSGLAAPIPALALVTGAELTWAWLACWLFVVSFLGVVVAIGLRRQMLLRSGLPFPAGIATAETLREIYGRGSEASARVRVLFTSLGIAGLLKLAQEFVVALPRWSPAISLSGRGASLHNLGFALDPSLLMLGFGAIVGLKVGLSLLLGAVLAWGWLGPHALGQGWVAGGAPGAVWFAPLVEWLLWPGVALMVSASLTTVVAAWLRRSRQTAVPAADAGATGTTGEVPAVWFWLGVLVAGVMSVVAQMQLFGIALYAAAIATLFAFGLAVVAARVAGETGITPIGATGKVTQVSFAFIAPGNISNNLMAANVTGGATDQCADLLHDLKAGLLLGAEPRLQAVAQLLGVAMGALVGSAAYLLLVPDPQAMLLTPEWPAPAVATWKAVAEVLQGGAQALPPGSGTAMAVAGVAGVVLALASEWAPAWGRWLPSGSAMGLAFVIPAWNSLSLCAGALLGAAVSRIAPHWAARFLLAIAAGLVAGESLAGIIAAASRLLAGT